MKVRQIPKWANKSLVISVVIFIVAGRGHGMGSDLFARYHLYSTIHHIDFM